MKVKAINQNLSLNESSDSRRNDTTAESLTLKLVKDGSQDFKFEQLDQRSPDLTAT